MQPFSIKSPVGQQTMEVDPTHLAARIAIRPVDHGVSGTLLGHYRAVAISGATISIAAAGVLLSLRWAAANYLVLMRITAWGAVQAPITAVADMGEMSAFIFRGSTGNAAAGTAISLVGSNQKVRQTMSSSQVVDLRVATAAAVTAATGKTNDAVPFASGGLAATLGTGITTLLVGTVFPKIDIYKWDALGQHPVVLSPNEGIEIQNTNTGPTAGATRYFFDLEWAEVAVF